VPIIAVGNLSVGGTGKTPMIEYLIRLLASRYKVATLSRGYKRKSTGFILADENTTADLIGDEPYQFFTKFPNITVAADVNRKQGIEKLLQFAQPDVVLLDDAFQHRAVKAGFYILLTTYDDLYADDLLLPAGNLREGQYGANRADVIIVTKCPDQLSADAKARVAEKLKLQSSQMLFFASVVYEDSLTNGLQTMTVDKAREVDKLLIAGIANPLPFLNYLRGKNDLELIFSDHHHFSKSDLLKIEMLGKDKVVVTTEKDYARLKEKVQFPVYYLPIKTALDEQDLFDNLIQNYVGIRSRNR
jgi:tetraacyldisaccharide 4'-kinase